MLKLSTLRRIQWILAVLLVAIILGPEGLGGFFFPLAALLFIISLIVYFGRRDARRKVDKPAE